LGSDIWSGGAGADDFSVKYSAVEVIETEYAEAEGQLGYQLQGLPARAEEPACLEGCLARE
jgi:hypothetical protein